MPLYRKSFLVLFAMALSVADTSASEIYRQVAPSSVQIIPAGQVHPRGSGALIDAKRGLILTADHVVRGLAKEAGKERVLVIFAQFENGKMQTETSFYRQRLGSLGIPGQVVFRDPSRDLALIQIERVPSGVKALVLASIDPEPGDTVHVIGNSGAQHGAAFSYCTGNVRNVFHWQRFASFRPVHILAHHAPTNKGDSGGPVVNERGELVGVVSTGTTGEPGTPSDWTFQQQVVDHSIHVSEVRQLMQNYADVLTVSPDVQKLIDQLRHPDPVLRMEAAKLLGRKGPAARAALPALETSLQDADPDVRLVASTAIRLIQGTVPRERPTAIRVLWSPTKPLSLGSKPVAPAESESQRSSHTRADGRHH